MPSVYLSPSLQEFNPYINGGTEEEYANLIVDAMEPYLIASGIEFGRNDPEMTLSEAIADSNYGDYDFHFSVHTNAGPPSLAGKLQGPDVYYYATSFYGREMAEIVAENLALIYPYPEKSGIVPTTTLAELKRTRVPAVLVEVAYHDNLEDAQWIKDNVEPIGEALAKSIAEYFGLPFIKPLEFIEM